MDYASFLERKTQLDGDHGFEPSFLPDFLFAFQRSLVEWATRKGRASVMADCGLGKTPIELVWAENVYRHTGKPVIVLAPLAVTFQAQGEAEKFGMDAEVSRDGTIPSGITITNYDRLHHFDPAKFGGVVCDESSAIKAFDGQRRLMVTEFMRKMPYRLLATATAAPNDYVELGTSSEALGYLGYMDMLGRFFTNDQRTSKVVRMWKGAEWRFKGHAEMEFWRWVASWGRAMRRPSDLGFSDDGFVLPPLNHRQHVVETIIPADGQLFAMPANGIREEREELRRTVKERCEMAASLLDGSTAGIAWCHLNSESALLAKLIDGAVEVKGSDPADQKEEALIAFGRGEIRALVTKPAIGAWGLNWQHCNRMTFFPSHSYEQYYQAVRRCWRFGQTNPVTVDIITTEGGANALANLQRKADQADRMFESLVAHMQQAMAIRRTDPYENEMEVPAWLTRA